MIDKGIICIIAWLSLIIIACLGFVVYNICIYQEHLDYINSQIKISQYPIVVKEQVGEFYDPYRPIIKEITIKRKDGWLSATAPYLVSFILIGYIIYWCALNIITLKYSLEKS